MKRLGELRGQALRDKNEWGVGMGGRELGWEIGMGGQGHSRGMIPG